MSETISLRPEYPRPQFERADWLNLNGEWEFAFDDADQGVAAGWWREEHRLAAAIRVPFPYESPLSGIGERGPHEVVWYARGFDLPPAYTGCKIWLHFGAVDYASQVWINGEPVGDNCGGHVPFSFEITGALRPGRNRLAVRVEDRLDPCQPRGRQSWKPDPRDGGYPRTTGIWQTVWLEPVAPTHVSRLRVTPDLDGEMARLEIEVAGLPPGGSAPGGCGLDLRARAFLEGCEVGECAVEVAGERAEMELPLRQMALWAPEHPFLYDLDLTLLRHGMVVDRVKSYFGMREVAVSGSQFLLNRQPLFPCLVLDPGYFGEGLLAAPSDEALRRDVEWVKALGFNGVRKHQKVEDPRWLAWCDRLGVLVWAEMPNAVRWSEDTAEAWVEEWARVIERDFNHPSIVAWVPLRESPGLAGKRETREFLEGLVALTRALDRTRLVMDDDTRARLRFAAAGGTPLSLPAVSERLNGRSFPTAGSASPEQVLEQLLAALAGAPEAVSGICYEQLADVEPADSGLLTADRQPKAPVGRVAALNQALIRCCRDRLHLPAPTAAAPSAEAIPLPPPRPSSTVPGLLPARRVGIPIPVRLARTP